MKLAIFDLDHTLLSGDSDFAWGQFLVRKNLVDVAYYERENKRFYEQYYQQCLDIHEYHAFVLAVFQGFDKATRQKLHQEFMASDILPLRQVKADALIQRHKQQGDELLIITATNRLIAGPIGPWLGINNILATDPEIIDGEITGRIFGVPCFREGKVTRLEAWLAEREPFQHTTFYSDSINDLPLLHYVDTPVVVNPDDALRQHAIQSQWSMLDLRDV